MRQHPGYDSENSFAAECLQKTVTEMTAVLWLPGKTKSWTRGRRNEGKKVCGPGFGGARGGGGGAVASCERRARRALIGSDEGLVREVVYHYLPFAN